MIKDNRTSYTPGEDFETGVNTGLCCQVFRCIAVLPGDQRTAAENQLTVTWLKDGQEIVHSPGRTEIENELRYSSGTAIQLDIYLDWFLDHLRDLMQVSTSVCILTSILTGNWSSVVHLD